MGDYIGSWPWALLEEHPWGESPRDHFHLCDKILSEMVSRAWVQKWLQMSDWLENIFWILRVACMEIYLNHAVIETVWVSLLMIRQATEAYLCSQRYLALPKEELHWKKHVDVISHFSLCTSKKKGKGANEIEVLTSYIFLLLVWSIRAKLQVIPMLKRLSWNQKLRTYEKYVE